jgi:hypothetical protein
MPADTDLFGVVLALAVPAILAVLREVVRSRTALALERQRQATQLEMIRRLPTTPILVHSDSVRCEIYWIGRAETSVTTTGR